MTTTPRITSALMALFIVGTVATAALSVPNASDTTAASHPMMPGRQPVLDLLPELVVQAKDKNEASHYPWMDDMRREGVKRAWIAVFAGLDYPPKEWEILNVAYYSDYKREGSQITEPKWLERIQKSGLADELNRVALEGASRSPWYEHESMLVPVDLLDDEKLPPQSYDQAQAEIRAATAELSPGSNLHAEIDDGAHGDGIHYFWMDKMRSLGVKRVIVLIDIEFNQNGRPRELKVARVRYYTKYDSDQAIIQDRERLQQIKHSGLEDDLKRLALSRAAHGSWLDVPIPRPNPFVGGADLEFFDNGWLPALHQPLYSTARPE